MRRQHILMVTYAYVLCIFFKDYKRGYEFGGLSIELADNYLDDIYLSIKLRHIVISFVMPWFEPYSTCCKALTRNYDLAMKMEEHEFSSYSIGNYDTLSLSTNTFLLQDFDQNILKTNIGNPIMKEIYQISRFFREWLMADALVEMCDHPPMGFKYPLSKAYWLHIQQVGYYIYGDYKKAYRLRKK